MYVCMYASYLVVWARILVSSLGPKTRGLSLLDELLALHAQVALLEEDV